MSKLSRVSRCTFTAGRDACTKILKFWEFRKSFPNSDHFRSQIRSQIPKIVPKFAISFFLLRS